MTRDDIIRMAQSLRDWGHWDQDDLVRFAALVAAHEREACLKLCETIECGYDNLDKIKAAIRARGQSDA